jgi:hypothetical protein
LILVALTLLTFIIPMHFAVKKTDFFYVKFLHPGNSLILGSSRALRGLDPDLLGENLEIDRPFLNFAFTLANSPFGPKYLNAIQHKIQPSTQNGLYILEVSPLAISTKTSNPEDDERLYRENQKVIDSVLFNSNPNPEYLIKHAERPFYLAFLKAFQAKRSVHDSGWNPSGRYIEDVANQQIIKTSTVYAETVFPEYYVSSKRIRSLEKTIEFLIQRGRVIVIRIPVSAEMWDLEEQYMPSFDSVVTEIAQKNGVEYINFKRDSSRFSLIDVHHLSLEASLELSKTLNQYLRQEISLASIF